MATKTQALKRVTTTATAATKAATAHAAAQEKRDQAILAARSASEPATYQEIADAASVTKDRVSQIIQAQRKQA
jgi:DNA-directed RNA polymerase sigma subunit (sigma70/sigma32)